MCIRDSYIIASSDKKLIKNSISSSENLKKKKFQYKGELVGLKNEKNILFTNKFLEGKFFNKEIFTENNGDNIATTFELKNKQLILKSYLLNNKKLEDDILIIFKIKPEKTIDDLLNLPNKIDQIDEIISINREDKINFLNYICLLYTSDAADDC